MNSKLAESIETIKRLKSNNKLNNYLNFIQFPFYRNIELNTRINFEFPLTVFIGQNGCGKSSCLHALFGAPINKTPSDFWFDTKVDPIIQYEDQKKRHCFWYSFGDESGRVREVIKARIKREDDPNYWETSRPLVWAGMQSSSRDNGRKRSKPISKDVLYIDFRSELSAFDKYFYFGNVKGTKSKNKQEFIRRKSVLLKKIFSEEIESSYTKSGPTNKKLRKLTDSELKWVSFILGKDYNSGLFLEHSIFRNDGYSVLFKTDYAEYSEAYAGSGEVAVVKLVLSILDAKAYSMILLDEPEVSLHPGAQSRLKLFLLDQIKVKKHQIILTSHSPTIVKGLPKESIKVFYQNPSSGRFAVKEDLTPEQAFHYIEFPFEDRRNIIVEDILAKDIVTGVLDSLGVEARDIFNVTFNPGGQSVIKKEFIPIFCRERESKYYVIFDGDQKPVSPHYDWRDFSTAELDIKFLNDKIREQVKEDIKFSVDGGIGGGNQEQKLLLSKQYLDYYLSNVFYLPKSIPEDIIWNNEKVKKIIQSFIDDEIKVQQSFSELENLTSTKQKFSYFSSLIYGSNRAEDIAASHKLFINSWLKEKDGDYFLIKAVLVSIIENIK